MRKFSWLLLACCVILFFQAHTEGGRRRGGMQQPAVCSGPNCQANQTVTTTVVSDTQADPATTTGVPYLDGWASSKPVPSRKGISAEDSKEPGEKPATVASPVSQQTVKPAEQVKPASTGQKKVQPAEVTTKPAGNSPKPEAKATSVVAKKPSVKATPSAKVSVASVAKPAPEKSGQEAKVAPVVSNSTQANVKPAESKSASAKKEEKKEVAKSEPPKARSPLRAIGMAFNLGFGSSEPSNATKPEKSFSKEEVKSVVPPAEVVRKIPARREVTRLSLPPSNVSTSSGEEELVGIKYLRECERKRERFGRSIDETDEAVRARRSGYEKGLKDCLSQVSELLPDEKFEELKRQAENR